MAPGIAVAFAAAGHPVVRVGTAHRSRGGGARRRPPRWRGCSRRRASPGSAEEVVARIEGAADWRASRAADVVVEAVARGPSRRSTRCSRPSRTSIAPDALLATNTSGLRVTDIAAPLRHRDRVVALHFWNPAHLMPIVEVAGGEHAAAGRVAEAADLVRAIGKVPVVLHHEVLGFLGTRMQQAVVREAIALLDAGVASAADIDLAVRTSFGVRFPAIGPLESADISGLDVIAAIHAYLLPDLDRSTAPQPASPTASAAATSA